MNFTITQELIEDPLVEALANGDLMPDHPRAFNKGKKAVDRTMTMFDLGESVTAKQRKVKVARIKKTESLIDRVKNFYITGLDGLNWYNNTYHAILEMFNKDIARTRLFIGLLAATSPSTAVKENVKRALYILKTLDRGQKPRLNFKSHAMNVERVLRGEPLSGPKVQAFEKNLLPIELGGDPDAVTVDLWMMRAFNRPSDSPSQAEYRAISKVIQGLAHEVGVEPRQYQAAVWVGIKRSEGDMNDTTSPFQKVLQDKLFSDQTEFDFEAAEASVDSFDDGAEMIEKDEGFADFDIYEAANQVDAMTDYETFRGTLPAEGDPENDEPGARDDDFERAKYKYRRKGDNPPRETEYLDVGHHPEGILWWWDKHEVKTAPAYREGGFPNYHTDFNINSELPYGRYDPNTNQLTYVQTRRGRGLAQMSVVRDHLESKFGDFDIVEYNHSQNPRQVVEHPLEEATAPEIYFSIGHDNNGVVWIYENGRIQQRSAANGGHYNYWPQSTVDRNWKGRWDGQSSQVTVVPPVGKEMMSPPQFLVDLLQQTFGGEYTEHRFNPGMDASLETFIRGQDPEIQGQLVQAVQQNPDMTVGMLMEMVGE